jgi:hypothetical protein
MHHTTGWNSEAQYVGGNQRRGRYGLPNYSGRGISAMEEGRI